MKIIEAKPRFPLQSHRDLAVWAPLIESAVLGFRVVRIFVPALPLHPDRYAKRTLVLELSSRERDLQLYLSLRAQECGAVILPAKTFRAHPDAPKSGFELGLAKFLPGARITGVTALPCDRILNLRFGPELSLRLELIPGRPAGLLMEGESLLQSTHQQTGSASPPPHPLSPAQESKIPFHPEWLGSIETYAAIWKQAEEQSQLLLRAKSCLKRVNGDLSAVERRLRSLAEQVENTNKEEDWARLGGILQMNLYRKPVPEGGFYSLPDPVTGKTLRIPALPGKSAMEQMNHCFRLAKRAKKRIQESAERIRSLELSRNTLLALKARIEAAADEAGLSEAEQALGIDRSRAAPGRKAGNPKIADFPGRKYVSKEGLTILAGRNLAENLELTFKIARGNDLWLHVKGRPGSHTVILLPPGRSASLDTLLDAAHLCILHSGGKDWGKTEVDYTSRKHVKRIKNQTEVSYTQNKTLAITLEESRVKRLSDG